MGMQYVLKDRKPVEADDLMEWARWFEEHENRRVASDRFGIVHVSTVFLGINHGYGEGPPILFETMIFGGEHDGYQDRCATWEEAEAMHRKAVSLVQS